MSSEQIVFMVILSVPLLFALVSFIVRLRTVWLRGSYYKKSRHDVKIDKTS